MLISDVLEPANCQPTSTVQIDRGQRIPVNLTSVLKQSQSNRVHRCISPPLIEESTRAIQMVEVRLVRRTPPEVHIANLKVAPEMARRVPIRDPMMVRPSFVVLQPLDRIPLRQPLAVLRHELPRLRPQACHALRVVVQIDGEAVGLVVVLHPREDVVVDVAEEVHVRLDAPVVPCVEQRGVLVEEAAVPAAHLVVGQARHVLHVLGGEERDGLLVEVVVDPGWDFPVLLGDLLYSLLLATYIQSCWASVSRRTEANFCFCLLSYCLHKLFRERNIVEKKPWIVELLVECSLQVPH